MVSVASGSGPILGVILIVIGMIAVVAAHGYYDSGYGSYEDQGTGYGSGGTHATQEVYSDGQHSYVKRSRTGSGSVYQRVKTGNGYLSSSQEVYQSNRKKVTGPNKREYGEKQGRIVVQKHSYAEAPPGFRYNSFNKSLVGKPSLTNRTGSNQTQNQTKESPNTTETGGKTHEPTLQGGSSPGNTENTPSVGSRITNRSQNQAPHMTKHKTRINGTGTGTGIIKITPPGGGHLIGDHYQTIPATHPQQTVRRQRGLIGRILAFLQQVIQAIMVQVHRAGTPR